MNTVIGCCANNIFIIAETKLKYKRVKYEAIHGVREGEKVADLEKTINDLVEIEENMTFYKHLEAAKVVSDAIGLLKEQKAMNVDAFVQWCIDSHIMGNASVRGIEYWVGKFKKGR